MSDELARRMVRLLRAARRGAIRELTRLIADDASGRATRRVVLDVPT